jgi:hypothetical protein
MIAISFTLGLRERPVTTTTWHLCTVIIPRRTITGRLVRGQVWRRHDGRHWLYKKFIVQGVGVANEWRRPARTKTVERQEHLDGGRETVRFGERRADKAA